MHTTVGRYLGTFAGTYGTYFVRIVSLFKMAHHDDVGVSIMELISFFHSSWRLLTQISNNVSIRSAGRESLVLVSPKCKQLD